MLAPDIADDLLRGGVYPPDDPVLVNHVGRHADTLERSLDVTTHLFETRHPSQVWDPGREPSRARRAQMTTALGLPLPPPEVQEGERQSLLGLRGGGPRRARRDGGRRRSDDDAPPPESATAIGRHDPTGMTLSSECPHEEIG
jgi:hypothetical protein